MKSLRKLIETTIRECLNENKDNELKIFLSNKDFINPQTKMFIYHGTKMSPDKFVLRDDYAGEDGTWWDVEMPDGYFFLTTDINEAKIYGKYIIPCELKRYDHKYFEVHSNNPSRVFDEDFDNNQFGFWDKFIDSRKSTLIIKGINKKWTVITNVENVIPRTDLAIDFYNLGGKK